MKYDYSAIVELQYYNTWNCVTSAYAILEVFWATFYKKKLLPDGSTGVVRNVAVFFCYSDTKRINTNDERTDSDAEQSVSAIICHCHFISILRSMISQLILTIARLKKKGGNEKINDATTHRHNKTAVFNMMHQLNNDLCFASEYSDNCVYQFKCQESITDESVLPNSADHPWLKGTSHAFPPPNTFNGPHDSAGGQDKARIKKSVKTTNVAVYTALDACCAAKAQYKRNCGIGSSTPSDEEPAEPSMPENWEENWCKVNDQDAYRVLKKESYAETAVFHIFRRNTKKITLELVSSKGKGN